VTGIPGNRHRSPGRCPRCDSPLEPLPLSIRPLAQWEELALLLVGGVWIRAGFALTEGALLALGFWNWTAWLVALAVLVPVAYLLHRDAQESQWRFHCAECGIDFPRDMVKRRPT